MTMAMTTTNCSRRRLLVRMMHLTLALNLDGWHMGLRWMSTWRSRHAHHVLSFLLHPFTPFPRSRLYPFEILLQFRFGLLFISKLFQALSMLSIELS